MIYFKKLIRYCLIALLIFLPFHTLFTVWAAFNWGHLYIWSGWKEALVLVAGVGGLVILFRDADLRSYFIKPLLNRMIILYLGLCALYVVVQRFQTNAIVGLAINVRFLIVFLVGQIAGYYGVLDKKISNKIILLCASVVAIGALLQATLLPTDILTRFGYDAPGIDAAGIPPATHVVAAGSDWYRAQSTLRGPNALGAYMLLPIFLAVYDYIRTKKKYLLYIVGGLTSALLVSYSRSALLGMIVGGSAWLITVQSSTLRNVTKKYLPAFSAVTVVFLVGVALVWKTPTFQKVVLHHNPTIDVVQSNEGHIALSALATKTIIQDPLGDGLGSAGPGSTLSGSSGGRIAENYFLQVGQEIGWLGLVLFLIVQTSVIVALWRKRQEPYALPVFATMIGLAFTNLLLHTWADEVVSIIVWCFAGLILGPKKIMRKSS